MVSDEFMDSLFKECSKGLGFKYEKPKEPEIDKEHAKILEMVKEAEENSRGYQIAKEMKQI